MARRTYGRARGSRRRPGNNRWRYLIGFAILAVLVFKFWPQGNVDTPAPGSAGSDPTSSADAVLQAADFQSAPPVTGTQSVSLQEISRKPEPAPGFTPERDAPANDRVDGAVQQGLALLKQNPNRLVEVRTQLNDLMLQPMAEHQRELIRQAMAQLADKWLFSRQVYADDALCGYYTVQPGDRLEKIGLQYSVPYQILMKINGIASAQDLRADSKIKVVNGPFHAKVNRSTFTLDLYLQKTLVKSYRVGLGMPGQETPTGEWLVKPGEKLIEPPWPDPVTGRYFTKDDPDYPLGSRWIALQGIEGEAKGRTGFAIHGTKDPDTIGTRSSQGCIRLYNGDVKEVYDMLLDGVSRVLVSD